MNYRILWGPTPRMTFYAIVDGDSVVWTRYEKLATNMSCVTAQRIRRRFVGGRLTFAEETPMRAGRIQ